MARRFGGIAVESRISDRIDSPNVVAVFRPALLWPRRLMQSIGEAKSDPILAHEIAHLVRRDHWVALLELLVGVVWW